MTKEAKEARREYKRKWARENPEKIRAQQARYWEKKARELPTVPEEHGEK